MSLAADLRAVADFLDAHPELVVNRQSRPCVLFSCDTPDELAAFHAAAGRAERRCVSGTSLLVYAGIGAVQLVAAGPAVNLLPAEPVLAEPVLVEATVAGWRWDGLAGAWRAAA